MGDQFTLQAPKEQEEGAWVAIPDNALLDAVVLSVVKTKMPFQDKTTHEDVYKMKFSFQVTEEGSQFKGRTVSGQTSVNFVDHEDCKFFQWVKALLNNELPQGFQLDVDDLQGLGCVVLVENVEKPRKDGKGSWINNNVIDVRPTNNSTVKAGSAFGGIDYETEPF